MSLATRLFPGDEELGKRDDDHKPGSKVPLPTLWHHRRAPARRTIKRLAIAAVVFVVVYYFFKNMPTNLQRRNIRPNYSHDLKDSTTNGAELQSPPVEAPPSSPNVGETQPKEGIANAPEKPYSAAHDYNGPIKFYDLAISLRGISDTMGYKAVNKNILFAAASLKSASILLPIACEMQSKEKNNVHFVFCGRDDIPLEILREINGVKDGCPIYFHDARPDNSVSSSDLRMEISSSAALGHIETYMHPQAVIIDTSGAEEAYLIKGIRDRSAILRKTLIELPPNAEKNLMWFTLLDSSSLSAWNKANVDILIHAQPAASGSLIRLLCSLWAADYSFTAPPRLIIELPHIVEPATTRFLSDTFRWPPNGRIGSNNVNLLTLHHRIPKPGLTAEENSIRLLESFWPASPDSHLLVLSPQAELSPLFFHYLKFMILEKKYSTEMGTHPALLGISLDLPSTYLNDTTAFTPPEGDDDASDGARSFLWQAPNSNAALYFGDKWPELHSFVSKSLTSAHSLPAPKTLDSKVVSKTYPGWLEHILALARARGYWMYYPVFDKSESLVTMHNELFQPPEEYLHQFNTANNEDLGEDDGTSKVFTVDMEKHLSLKRKELPRLVTPLVNLLPRKTGSESATEPPLLSWDGERVSSDELVERAESFAVLFRHEVGGCDPDAEQKEKTAGSVDDLFCFDRLDDTKTAKAPVDDYALTEKSTPKKSIVESASAKKRVSDKTPLGKEVPGKKQAIESSLTDELDADETASVKREPFKKPAVESFPTREHVAEALRTEKQKKEKSLNTFPVGDLVQEKSALDTGSEKQQVRASIPEHPATRKKSPVFDQQNLADNLKAVDPPADKQSLADKANAKKSNVESSPADDSLIAKVPLKDAAVKKPAAGKPVGKAPLKRVPADDPSSEKSASHKSTAEQGDSQAPLAENPVNRKSSAGKLDVPAAAADKVSIKTPAPDKVPAVEKPPPDKKSSSDDKPQQGRKALDEKNFLEAAGRPDIEAPQDNKKPMTEEALMSQLKALKDEKVLNDQKDFADKMAFAGQKGLLEEKVIAERKALDRKLSASKESLREPSSSPDKKTLADKSEPVIMQAGSKSPDNAPPSKMADENHAVTNKAFEKASDSKLNTKSQDANKKGTVKQDADTQTSDRVDTDRRGNGGENTETLGKPKQAKPPTQADTIKQQDKPRRGPRRSDNMKGKTQELGKPKGSAKKSADGKRDSKPPEEGYAASERHTRADGAKEET